MTILTVNQIEQLSKKLEQLSKEELVKRIVTTVQQILGETDGEDRLTFLLKIDTVIKQILKTLLPPKETPTFTPVVEEGNIFAPFDATFIGNNQAMFDGGNNA